MRLESALLLDDRALAEALLQQAPLSKADMVLTLRLLLKMKYFPVAVKFFYQPQELEAFKATASYKTARNPLTFCHQVAASRQRGEILLITPEKIGCGNARYVLGWKEKDAGEIQSLIKYTRDRSQAERFLAVKKRMPPGLLAVVTAPLQRAVFEPDVIHGLSDPLQAYHLANDWCAVSDTQPFRMTMTANASVCHGVVAVHLDRKPNLTPMCSGSYTAGKTEQGEINWIWPWADFPPTLEWMLERTLRDGGVSFPRTGEPYPGFNVCKLCPFLNFLEPVDPVAGGES